MENYMLPLAGADEIGASAYFVNIDGVKILFDAGARTGGSLKFPDYVILKEVLGGYDGLDYIILSHAHMIILASWHLLVPVPLRPVFWQPLRQKHLPLYSYLTAGRLAVKGKVMSCCRPNCGQG